MSFRLFVCLTSWLVSWVYRSHLQGVNCMPVSTFWCCGQAPTSNTPCEGDVWRAGMTSKSGLSSSISSVSKTSQRGRSQCGRRVLALYSGVSSAALASIHDYVAPARVPFGDSLG